MDLHAAEQARRDGVLAEHGAVPIAPSELQAKAKLPAAGRGAWPSMGRFGRSTARCWSGGEDRAPPRHQPDHRLPMPPQRGVPQAEGTLRRGPQPARCLAARRAGALERRPTQQPQDVPGFTAAWFLSGTAAAGGIAIINSIGNLSGFAGPFVMGKMKDATGSYTVGLLAVAGVVFLAMLVALSLPHEAKLEQVEAEQEPNPLRQAAE